MITLSYPGYNPTTNIQLPDPELNDNHSLQKNITVHVSRNGTVRTYSNNNANRLLYQAEISFDNLTKNQLKSLIDFLILSEGNFIRYVDYNDNTWICKMSEETIQEVSDGRGATACDNWDESKSYTLVFTYWEQ